MRLPRPAQRALSAPGPEPAGRRRRKTPLSTKSIEKKACLFACAAALRRAGSCEVPGSPSGASSPATICRRGRRASCFRWRSAKPPMPKISRPCSTPTDHHDAINKTLRERSMKADLVVKNGWVVTPEETFKGGVAISAEKFVAIGVDDSLPDGAEVIDANGKHILPGIIDA